MIYSFIELSYRDGNKEQFSPELTLCADGKNLWISDAKGPLFVRPLPRLVMIQLREVTA